MSDAVTINQAEFRRYFPDELGDDGYPLVWHVALKHWVRETAGHRCLRCGHPYMSGENPLVRERDEEGREVWASWSPCDTLCTHLSPVRVPAAEGGWVEVIIVGSDEVAAMIEDGIEVEARWRILTVHHLDGDKANCCWWNLVSLCQRCHLTTQRKVQMARVWPWEHSAWFRPYAAGYYAHVYLGEDLTRPQVSGRLDELLALERMV